MADWLDLSTGIAPCAYPVPPILPAAWQRLPEDEDGLAATACRYYGARRVLAVLGVLWMLTSVATGVLPDIFAGSLIAGGQVFKSQVARRCRI